MPIPFSNGLNADVYRVADKSWGMGYWKPRADLVREEGSAHAKKMDAKILFYGHRIAHLLFPENVIEVTGATMQGGVTQLFSRIADVPPEHARYSRDIYRIGMDPKHSGCRCEACTVHREYHKTNGLEQKADETAKVMAEFGIYGHSADITDYCMKPNGEIVFFELNVIPRLTEERVRASNLAVRDDVLRLLERYQELKAQREKANTIF